MGFFLSSSDENDIPANKCCQCSTCTDTKEIQELKMKVYYLEQQINALEKIVDIYKNAVNITGQCNCNKK